MKYFFLVLFSIVFLTSQVGIPQNILDDYRNNYEPTDTILGCVSETGQEVPLTDLTYNVLITNSLAEVELRQTFENTNSETIEIEYLFAISSNAAFVQLNAEFENTILVGEIKEKQEALKEYEEAIENGETAAFAEQSQENHGAMRLKLGNLEAGKTVTIIFKYLELLEVALNKFWILVLPATFSPFSITADDSEPCPWEVNIRLNSPSDITTLVSPTHDIITEYSGEDYAEIELDETGGLQYPENDFILLYRNADINQIQHKITHTDDDQFPFAAQISFFPDFNKATIQESLQVANHWDGTITEEYSTATNSNIRAEYIFILDRSGSMDAEQRIYYAKQTLISCIQQIPADSYFQIYSFGTTFEKMFNEAQFASEGNRNNAFDNIATFDADLGGTDLLQVLEDMDGYKEQSGYPVNIFMITDGQVQNTDACIIQIREIAARRNYRVYSVGIGGAVSKELIIRGAQAGNGEFKLVENASNIEDQVAELLTDSITPFIDNISVTFNSNIVEAMVPKIEAITALKKNEAFNIIIFFSSLTTTPFQISYFDSESNEIMTHEITLNAEEAEETANLHKIGVYKMIQSILFNSLYQFEPRYDIILNNPNNLDIYDQVLALSIKYQVLCELTAFILVIDDDYQMENQDVGNDMKMEDMAEQSAYHESGSKKLDGIYHDFSSNKAELEEPRAELQQKKKIFGNIIVFIEMIFISSFLLMILC